VRAIRFMRFTGERPRTSWHRRSHDPRGDAGSDLGGEHSTAEGPKPYLVQTPIIAIHYDDVKKGTGERLEIEGNRGI